MESRVSGAVTSTATLMPTEDRVTTYGWKALAGSVIGYSMDGFDMLILGFMLAAISVGLIYSVENLADFQAIQLWRIEWLLGAVVAFLAVILLKRAGSSKE